jgi:transcriptional regulator GlxA family with amidase domain
MSAPDVTSPVPLEVLLFLFDDVEVLDFAGPFEVFSISGHPHAPRPFQVRTVARSSGPVRARNGLAVLAEHTFETAPPPDVLVVPGGVGTRPLLADPYVLDWLIETSPKATITLSVCTGALLLGAAGLLRGLRATTHHGAFAELREVAPETRVLEHARIVDNGAIVTSAGISAGIDAALHVVGRLAGQPIAEETARYMEYDWVVGRGVVS